MAGLLQDVHDNQGIALLYLSDDLDSVERAAVEQRMASDLSLRQCVDEMRRSQELVFGALAALDAPHANPIAQAAAIRRVNRLMVQKQVEELQCPAVIPQAGLRRVVPRWAYPLAAAAAVAFLLVGLSAMGVFDFPPDTRPGPLGHVLSQQDSLAADRIIAKAPVANDKQVLSRHEAVVADLERSLGEPTAVGLDNADKHMNALTAVDEDDLSVLTF